MKPSNPLIKTAEKNKRTCFWGHNFRDWEIIEEGNLKYDDIRVGRFIFQKRQCKDCKFTELDTQKTMI